MSGWEKAFALAATGDVVTSEIALRGDYGLKEWNTYAPWADTTAGRVGISVGVVLVVILASRWLRKHGGVWGARVGRGLLVLGTGVNTFLTGWNIAQMRGRP